MTFVALSIPDWPTGAASNDLLAQLLAVAPRAAVNPAEHLAWLDARGLDPAALVERAREALAEIGVTEVFAGAARVPIVAAIVASEGQDVRSGGLRFAGARPHNSRAGEPRPAFGTSRPSHTTIAAGAERSYLAPLPLDVLSPPDKLMSLFAGVGLETCGDLARLSRESVEVRFGRDGLAVWRLARADDRRPIFSARPRELPNASLDWTEFSTTDLEQLVFVLHSLLRTVCDALARDGMGARSLTLMLILENHTTITRPVGAARSTAQRTTWLRLMRRALERITLPDRVTGIAVQVDTVGAPEVRQGDLFDPGFASAGAAEGAVAHVMDLQGDAVVALQRCEHPLLERRVRWVVEQEAVRHEPLRVHSTRNVGILAEPTVTGAWRTANEPALHPMLLPAPREITVLTQSRRGFAIPIHYTDNNVKVSLTECLGPHCLSGERWTEPFTREYHQGVRADGIVVLLYRDVPSDTWYLAGWWD